MVKQIRLISSWIIVGTMIGTFIVRPHQYLLTWLNLLFVVSLVLIIIGCTIIIWTGGFCHHFIRDVAYFFKRLSKIRGVVATTEGEETYRHKHLRPRKVPFIKHLTFASVITSVLSIILSYVVFV